MVVPLREIDTQFGCRNALDAGSLLRVPGIIGMTDAAGETFGTSRNGERFPNMDQFKHRPDVREGVVALGLAARHDRALFVPAFARAWPIEEASQFTALLHQIDRAECEAMRAPASDLR